METLAQTVSNDETEYHAYLDRIQQRFDSITGQGGEPLFTTTSIFESCDGTLFDVFISNLPAELQQHYTCTACRHFINRFGHLVVIRNGYQIPVMWMGEEAPEFLRAAVRKMEQLVEKSAVNGVFESSDAVLGQPVTGEWRHLAVKLPTCMIHKSMTKSAGQASAEKLEDYNTVRRALEEFNADIIDQAITVLNSDALYRSEKVLGVANWLKLLYALRASTKNTKLQDNLLWLEIAKAPAGFCHPRSSMIGTLLEDILAGLPFETVKARFDKKMHPLQYQRPQVAPTSGNLKQAEELIAKLGAAGSLARRYAKLEEIPTIWKPKQERPVATEAGSVFGHLKTKEEEVKQTNKMVVPPKTITWEKFQREVLPTAEKIEFSVPYRPMSEYSPLVTAVDPTSPPIIQWDAEENRNPVSWYHTNGGISPTDFNLVSGTNVEVAAVTLQPTMWSDKPYSHFGKGVIFILKGAKPKRDNSGLCLFPEILRSEFHGIRSSIEAYSKSKKIEGAEDATAAGVKLNDGQMWSDINLQVTTGNVVAKYKLDRWE